MDDQINSSFILGPELTISEDGKVFIGDKRVMEVDSKRIFSPTDFLEIRHQFDSAFESHRQS